MCHFSGRAERCRTFPTLISLFVGVNPSMNGEIATHGEGRRAQFTGVGSLPAVNPLMSGQAAFESELLPTRSTSERFITFVAQPVYC